MINSYFFKYWFIIFISLIISVNSFSQKKLRIGVGSNIHAGAFDKRGNNDLLKIPFGLGLYIDYSLSNAYILKTRLEINIQKLEVPQFFSHNMEKISIPLLLSRAIYKTENQNLQFGVEGGFSWDFIPKLNINLKDVLGLEIAKLTSLRTVSNLSKPNIAARLGFVILKKLKNKNELQIYFHYIRSIQNWDYLLLETQKDIVQDGNFFTYEKERHIVDLFVNALQCGLYYNFCLKCNN